MNSGNALRRIFRQIAKSRSDTTRPTKASTVMSLVALVSAGEINVNGPLARIAV
jgi:hypothetical protein